MKEVSGTVDEPGETYGDGMVLMKEGDLTSIHVLGSGRIDMMVGWDGVEMVLV